MIGNLSHLKYKSTTKQRAYFANQRFGTSCANVTKIECTKQQPLVECNSQTTTAIAGFRLSRVIVLEIFRIIQTRLIVHKSSDPGGEGISGKKDRDDRRKS